MSTPAHLDSAIEYFRDRHEALFGESLEIRRSTGEGTFDPDTGLQDDDPYDVIYSGSGQIRTEAGIGGGIGSDATTGERELRFEHAALRVPHDTAIEENDVVVVTSSLHNPGLAGHRFRITDVSEDGWQVVRKAILEKIAGDVELEESS